MTLDIIEKIMYASWGSRVVPVVKKNDQIRLYADYKCIVNKFLHVTSIPYPELKTCSPRWAVNKVNPTYTCRLKMRVYDATSYQYLQRYIQSQTINVWNQNSTKCLAKIYGPHINWFKRRWLFLRRHYGLRFYVWRIITKCGSSIYSS